MVLKTLQSTAALEVQGTHRSGAADPLRFDTEEGLEGIQTLLNRTGRFDYLINCVGVTSMAIDERDVESVRRAHAVNGRFPHELATAAAEVGGRVIHVSTDGVFPVDAGSCFEDTPTKPPDVYGETKAAGELSEAHTITLRCSIVGPDPIGQRGLLEWLLSQPDGAEVSGYSNYLWNGVTTLQFAELCRDIVLRDGFEQIRAASAIHHFCPNPQVSKYDLLARFAKAFGKSVTVQPVQGPAPGVTRTLGTRYDALKAFHGDSAGIDVAVERLASVIY
jgi:dTDP-4-dehydrorhamnose reductase